MTCVCQAGGRTGEQQIRTVVTINEEVEKQFGPAGKAKIELEPTGWKHSRSGTN